jgi:hypothetical protein
MKKQYPVQSNAPEFIAAIRESLLVGAKKWGFRYPRQSTTPPQKAKSVIDPAVAALAADLCGDGVTEKHIKTLIYRFERRCTAIGQSVKYEARPEIIRLLAGDLKNNCKSFASLKIPVDTADLIWFTLYNGPMGDFQFLPKEYVKKLVVESPLIAQKSLNDSNHTVESVIGLTKNSKKFSSLAGHEKLIVYAVLNHPSPVNYLLNIVNGNEERPNLDPTSPDTADVGFIVDTVRKKQRQNNVMPRGSSLGQTALLAIRKAAEELFAPKTEEQNKLIDDLQKAHINKDHIVKLMGRFEDLHKRVLGHFLPDHLRPIVMKHITLDFLTNCQSIGGDPFKIVSLTVIYGQAQDIVKRYTAEKVKLALMSNPADPLKILAADPVSNSGEKITRDHSTLNGLKSLCAQRKAAKLSVNSKPVQEEKLRVPVPR